MNPQDMLRLQTQIGLVLRFGAGAAAVVLVTGLALWALALPAADTVLAAGLILLMAIPVTRIAASLIEAIRRRDHLLIWSTAIVLAVMAFTLVLSLVSS